MIDEDRNKQSGIQWLMIMLHAYDNNQLTTNQTIKQVWIGIGAYEPTWSIWEQDGGHDEMSTGANMRMCPAIFHRVVP